MGCKSKYRDNEAFGLQEGCSSASQGRALEPAGDRRPREMTVAPQGEQNPAYSLGSLFYKRLRFYVEPLCFWIAVSGKHLFYVDMGRKNVVKSCIMM